MEYSHIDIPIPRGCSVKGVEQRGDFVRINYGKETEYKIETIDWITKSKDALEAGLQEGVNDK